VVVLKVRLFGLFREVVGSKEILLHFNDVDVTVSALKRGFFDVCPDLVSLGVLFVVAVNRKVVGDTAKVTPTDEVALLPLVSGG
jgi:molybdopterin converting factor small subunit